MTVLQLPTWEQLLAAVAVIGVVASFWRQFLNAFTRVKSALIVTRAVDNSIGPVLVAFLHATMRMSVSPLPTYSSSMGFVKPMGRIYRVMYQVLYGGRETMTFWRGSRPLWFRSVNTGGSEERFGCRTEYLFQISYVRGTFDWEDLLFQATVWEDGMKHGDQGRRRRFRVETHYGSAFDWSSSNDRGTGNKVIDGEPPTSNQGPEWNQPTHGNRFIHWTAEDIAANTIVSRMDQLSLRPELMDLTEVIKFWHVSKQWYLEHGIPWRLGILGHGRPGTGKTSYIRAIAELLDMPVHTFDLASMSNQDLNKAWRRMLNDAPCVALLEDIDGVFNGRTNITPSNGMGVAGVTFDTLLKCIDGIERTDGMLLFVTTNHFETIDDALAGKPDPATAGADDMPTRPGRIDQVVEFKDLDDDGRYKMAIRILEDPELAMATTQIGTHDSAAQFQERCFRIALKRRFDEREEAA